MERKSICEIDRLFPHRFPNDGGNESLVYFLKDIVFKEFVSSIPISILKGKEKKLLEISTMTNLQQFYPEIIFLINSILNEYIRGYIMKPVKGTSISKIRDFDFKIKAIHNIRKVLEEFRNVGFLYLDIRNPNIRIDKNGNATLLDIDSIMYLDNPKFDVTPTDVKDYMDNGGKVNAHTQIFMLNIYTQEALLLTKDELDKTGAKILTGLQEFTPDSDADNEYLIDHIKRKGR